MTSWQWNVFLARVGTQTAFAIVIPTLICMHTAAFSIGKSLGIEREAMGLSKLRKLL